MTDAQERFLRAIADRVPAASIAELHLFPAIRQGGYETGIAVIAAEPEMNAEAAALAPGEDAEGAAAGPDEHGEGTAVPDARLPDDATSPAPDAAHHRLIVLSARYRLTLKGPERGTWDVEVVAEADAPLVTVDAVVRGVQRRAGDVGHPERLSGEALRALLGDWSCTPTTR